MGRTRKRDRIHRDWEIRLQRPEEIYSNPLRYFNPEEVVKYARSSGMRNAQRDIANRILDLLSIDPGSSNKEILDIGCGVGYTMEIYQSRGYRVSGLDLSQDMLEYAKREGFDVVCGDMRDLGALFKPEQFVGVLSASALQWLKEKSDIIKTAKGINYVLESGGRSVIQFYPRSEEELRLVGKIFKREGFEIEIITDNPDNPRKRINYLVLQKY